MSKKKIFSNTNVIIAIVTIFTLWLSFGDQDNFLALRSVDRQIAAKEKEKSRYIELIRLDSVIITGIKDSAFVEKYAREHFFYKAPNETIYLIDEN